MAIDRVKMRWPGSDRSRNLPFVFDTSDTSISSSHQNCSCSLINLSGYLIRNYVPTKLVATE